jgi:Domain of unknown function (DUF4157)
MHDQQHRTPVHLPTSEPGTRPRVPLRRPAAPGAEAPPEGVQRKEDGGHAGSDASPPDPPSPSLLIHRKCSACEEEDAKKKHPQAKLAVSHPGDALEQEADRVADRVMRAADPAMVGRAPALVLSRKQDGAESQGDAGSIVGDVLRSSGQPLPEATRSFMEPRFGRDFGDVRVHTDADASRSAEAVAARAYTVGSDVVFRSGEYAPESHEGARLLAHELTHVAQQAPATSGDGIKLHRDNGASGGGGGAAPAAAPAGGSADSGGASASAGGASNAGGDTAAQGDKPTSGLIVDDGETKLDPKQMRKGDFLAAARSAVNAAVDEGYDSFVDRFAAKATVAARFLMYSAQDAKSLEQTIHGQVGASAGTAAGYVPAIVARVKREIAADVADKKKQEKQPKADDQQGGADDQKGGIFFKAREGGPREGADPEAVQAALEGGGQPLPGGLRAGIESAMGHSFSGVRVHTGATAHKLSGELDARAFTVGQDVAFGAGEYRPGTPVGDALIAHELAHVAQQGNSHDAAVAPKSEAAHDGPLEADADEAAAGAVLSLWGGVKAGALGLARKAGAALKTGLKLQRCSRKKEEPQPDDAGPQTREQICKALCDAQLNNERLIELYNSFLAGKVPFEEVLKKKKVVGLAGKGVVGEGKKMPQVVQDSINEGEKLTPEEAEQAGKLLGAGLGNKEKFQETWVRNEIGRQQRLGGIYQRKMGENGCTSCGAAQPGAAPDGGPSPAPSGGPPK